jgi:alkyl hydroperoxide reductase subunit AhpC
MFADIKINQPAPNFKLKGVCAGHEGIWDLSEMREKWTILFFYPADFTDVCPTEVKGFQKMLKEFEARNCQVLGCSTDSHHTHRAWAESLGGIDYPLLADIHHTTSIDYNVFVEEEAVSLRGTFIINPEGDLKYYQVSDNTIGRNVEEILRVVDALQSGKLCPVNWKRGDQTID